MCGLLSLIHPPPLSPGILILPLLFNYCNEHRPISPEKFVDCIRAFAWKFKRGTTSAEQPSPPQREIPIPSLCISFFAGRGGDLAYHTICGFDLLLLLLFCCCYRIQLLVGCVQCHQSHRHRSRLFSHPLARAWILRIPQARPPDRLTIYLQPDGQKKQKKNTYWRRLECWMLACVWERKVGKTGRQCHSAYFNTNSILN